MRRAKEQGKRCHSRRNDEHEQGANEHGKESNEEALSEPNS